MKRNIIHGLPKASSPGQIIRALAEGHPDLLKWARAKDDDVDFLYAVFKKITDPIANKARAATAQAERSIGTQDAVVLALTGYLLLEAISDFGRHHASYSYEDWDYAIDVVAASVKPLSETDVADACDSGKLPSWPCAIPEGEWKWPDLIAESNKFAQNFQSKAFNTLRDEASRPKPSNVIDLPFMQNAGATDGHSGILFLSCAVDFEFKVIKKNNVLRIRCYPLRAGSMALQVRIPSSVRELLPGATPGLWKEVKRDKWHEDLRTVYSDPPYVFDVLLDSRSYTKQKGVFYAPPYELSGRL